MIYPFQLSFSNLIGAFYDTALEIIMQNTELSRHEAVTGTPGAALGPG